MQQDGGWHGQIQFFLQTHFDASRLVRKHTAALRAERTSGQLSFRYDNDKSERRRR